MKSVLMGLGIFVAIVAAGGLLFVGWILYSFLFVGHIAERKINRLDDFMPLAQGVSIEEVPYHGPQPQRHYGRAEDPDAGWLIQEDSTVTPAQTYSSTESGQPAYRLPLPPGINRRAYDSRQAELWQPIEERLKALDNPPQYARSTEALLLASGKVFHEQAGKAGQAVGTLVDEETGETISTGIQYAAWANDRYFVMAGYQHTDKGTETPLWQGERDTFRAHKVDPDTFYLHAKLPDMYDFAEINSRIMVYFNDSLSWGFGGDVTKPKFSILRIYNATWPEGKDIAKFSFSAGMVRDIRLAEGSEAGDATIRLQVLTDPARPSGAEDKKERPARQWRVTLPTDEYTAIDS